MHYITSFFSGTPAQPSSPAIPEDNFTSNVPPDEKFKCYRKDAIAPRLRRICGTENTIISVTNQDTVVAALELIRENSYSLKPVKPENIAILDMANAKKPGGYHEDDGVKAQEEQLIRRSPSLLKALEAAKKFRNPNDAPSARGEYKQEFIPEDGCLYLSDVQFTRTRNSSPDSDQITVATICAAAIDLYASGGQIQHSPEYETIMKNKIRAILFSAFDNQKTDLVLGAFGCGMFGNDPTRVAQFFKDVIHNEFHGVFRNIVFAIYDSSEKGDNIKPFAAIFPKQFRI